jgi:hypothetical protein
MIIVYAYNDTPEASIVRALGLWAYNNGQYAPAAGASFSTGSADHGITIIFLDG